jgi:hypothetical protein
MSKKLWELFPAFVQSYDLANKPNTFKDIFGHKAHKDFTKDTFYISFCVLRAYLCSLRP